MTLQFALPSHDSTATHPASEFSSEGSWAWFPTWFQGVGQHICVSSPCSPKLRVQQVIHGASRTSRCQACQTGTSVLGKASAVGQSAAARAKVPGTKERPAMQGTSFRSAISRVVLPLPARSKETNGSASRKSIDAGARKTT